MPNPFLGIRIPTDLNEALIARMQETGQSKSEVVIAALRDHLGLASHQKRLDAIEQRLSILEAVVGAERLPETSLNSYTHQNPEKNHRA